MKKIKNKKNIIVIIIALICIVGFSYAYFTNYSSLNNNFDSFYYSVSVTHLYNGPGEWAPGETYERKIFAVNKGSVDVAVRVSYENIWKVDPSDVLDDDINLLKTNEIYGYSYLPNIYHDIELAIVNYGNVNDWVKEGDYYYYKKKLSKNESTSSFIDSITYNENAVDNSDNSCDINVSTSCSNELASYDKALYLLNFDAEFIQYDVYKDVWNTNVEIN